MNITELNLSVRAENLLRGNGITTTEDLSRYSIAEIRRLRNCGRKTERELLDLREKGIVKFAEDITPISENPQTLQSVSDLHSAIDMLIKQKDQALQRAYNAISQLQKENKAQRLELNSIRGTLRSPGVVRLCDLKEVQNELNVVWERLKLKEVQLEDTQKELSAYKKSLVEETEHRKKLQLIIDRQRITDLYFVPIEYNPYISKRLKQFFQKYGFRSAKEACLSFDIIPSNEEDRTILDSELKSLRDIFLMEERKSAYEKHKDFTPE